MATTCSLGECAHAAYCRGLCRSHYCRWQRQGKPEMAAWLVRGGRQLAACKICGKEFAVNRSQVVCSPECAAENARRSGLEHYHRSAKRRADLLAAARRRRQENPEQARAQDRCQWQRIKADPARRAAAKQKAKEHYARHAEKIQARRKARLATLTDAQFFELLDRMREYGRNHRRRERADPAKLARRQAYEAEYRRRREEARVAEDFGRLTEILAARAEGETKPKPCVVCGGPVVGKASSAKTCSAECRRVRHLQMTYPPRPRPCKWCGEIFADKTSAKYCATCRQKHPLPQTAVCEWCNRDYPPKVHGQRGCCRAHSKEIFRRDKRRESQERALPLPPRSCVVCGKRFLPDRKNAKTCSGAGCRAELKRRLERERQRRLRNGRDANE